MDVISAVWRLVQAALSTSFSTTDSADPLLNSSFKYSKQSRQELLFHPGLDRDQYFKIND